MRNDLYLEVRFVSVNRGGFSLREHFPFPSLREFCNGSRSPRPITESIDRRQVNFQPALCEVLRWQFLFTAQRYSAQPTNNPTVFPNKILSIPAHPHLPHKRDIALLVSFACHRAPFAR